MNDFQAHGLRSMGLLELATDEHGRKAKNFYREDAKYAKKQQKRLDFLSSFALFASSRWECFYAYEWREVYAWLSEAI